MTRRFCDEWEAVPAEETAMSSQRLVQCVNCNVIVELPEVAQGWLDMTPVTRWLFQYGIGWRCPECSVRSAQWLSRKS